MAEIKWIKLTTDMFDNRKIKHLRRLPEGNNIVLIWVMLLTMAGRCNSGGMIFLTENIPYTPKMLADELDFEENTVQLAMTALEQLGMIVTNNGFFAIAGWDEHQNIEGMEKIREQNRIRQQRKRERAKQALIGNGSTCEYCGKEGTTIDHIIPKTKGGKDVPENTVCSCLACNMSKTNRSIDVFLNEKIETDSTFDVSRILTNSKIMQFVLYDGFHFLSRDITKQVTQSHATDIDKEEDKDKEIDKSISTDLQSVADLYHSICVSFPKIRSLSDARKKSIKARLKSYSLEDFRTVFENAENSSFLKGSDGGWKASFDWLIKEANMLKVLEGNYQDKPKRYGRKEPVPGWAEHSLGDAELEAIQKAMQADLATVGNDAALADRAEKLKQRLSG